MTYTLRAVARGVVREELVEYAPVQPAERGGELLWCGAEREVIDKLAAYIEDHYPSVLITIHPD